MARYIALKRWISQTIEKGQKRQKHRKNVIKGRLGKFMYIYEKILSNEKKRKEWKENERKMENKINKQKKKKEGYISN